MGSCSLVAAWAYDKNVGTRERGSGVLIRFAVPILLVAAGSCQAQGTGQKEKKSDESVLPDSIQTGGASGVQPAGFIDGNKKERDDALKGASFDQLDQADKAYFERATSGMPGMTPAQYQNWSAVQKKMKDDYGYSTTGMTADYLGAEATQQRAAENRKKESQSDLIEAMPQGPQIPSQTSPDVLNHGDRMPICDPDLGGCGGAIPQD